jgi:NitT/TauT family transport system permease protein
VRLFLSTTAKGLYDKASMSMTSRDWFAVRKELAPRRQLLLTVFSFLLPVLLWCLISYVPFLWHPMMKITDTGGISYFSHGMLVEKGVFARENATLLAAGKPPATGVPANPVFLPAPHQVAKAFYTAFTTAPLRPDEPWLHESLWQSIQVIFWGFFLSSLVGLPIGILCGSFQFFSKLEEPFIEFFRYLPAPAFGALAVAVLGIYDAPKIAIIFIGTFFQQVLVIANTTRKIDCGLLEAAQTLGASRRQLVTRVVIPGVITDLYTDMRILLGWAWTYLIVAELIGSSSGITYFINQQAKYRIYENVYAAIIMIGILGLGCDLILATLGKFIFPWKPSTGFSPFSLLRKKAFADKEETAV